jgi:predicted ATP-dependent endonuclease of OLD family
LDFDLRETRIVRFDRTQRSVTQPWCVADSVLEKMAPKLRQTGNERIAFASRVVLCEGKGDQAAIRTLAEETRLDLDSYNIGVIDCDGRDNIPDYARFCSALGLHYLAVQDGDASKPDAKPKVEAVRNAVAATDFGLLFEFYENIETSLGCAKKDTDVLSRAMRQAASDDSVPAEIAELRSKLSDLVRGVALTA